MDQSENSMDSGTKHAQKEKGWTGMCFQRKMKKELYSLDS